MSDTPPDLSAMYPPDPGRPATADGPPTGLCRTCGQSVYHLADDTYICVNGHGAHMDATGAEPALVPDA